MNFNEPAATADYIASHALLALLLLTLVGSLLSGLVWHAILKAGPAIWTAVLRLWMNMAGDRALHLVQSVRYVGPAFKGTLSAARFLGIYAVCAFVVALLSVGTFLELADAIDVDDELTQFDLTLSNAMGRHVPDEVLRTLSLTTHFGDSAVLAVLAIGIVVTLFVRRQQVLAWACLVAAIGGGTLTLMLKQHFARSRPTREHEFAVVSGYSFPSGHASGAMLVYGLLGYLIVRHTRPQWHIPVVVAIVAMIVFVGGSRILLQVHFLSDVLAGWTISAAWLGLWIAGLEAVRRRSAVDQISVAAPVHAPRQA